MKIKIVNPIKAYISEYKSSELENIKKELTYSNTSVSFNLKKLSSQTWFKKNHYDKWLERYNELKSQLKNTLVYSDYNGTYIRAGAINLLKNVDFTTENLIEYPKQSKYEWKTLLPFEPYYYQKEAVQKLIENKHAAISLPTGAGKTACLLMATQQMGLKTAIVVPTKGIFLEVFEAFQTHFGKDMVGAFGNGKKDIEKPITVCIGKSVSMVKKGTKEATFFSEKELFLADECHLLAAAELEKIAHQTLAFAPYRFFLSGTQTRGDGAVLLLKSITGPLVYSMSTKEAIENGFLSPLEFRIVSVPPEKVDFDSKDASKMKEKHILYNKNIIKKAAQIANSVATSLNENVLILVEEIEQMALVAKELTVPYVYTHGNTYKNEELASLSLSKTNLEEVLEKFHKRIDGTMVLIGTENISIGVNTFAHHGINLQAGASEIGTKQGIIGRMVRITHKSKYAQFHKEKKVARIWDFRITPAVNRLGRKYNYEILERHLQKRIGFYKETGGIIMEF
jgi:superfamily II DNA or RNA helicase